MEQKKIEEDQKKDSKGSEISSSEVVVEKSDIKDFSNIIIPQNNFDELQKPIIIEQSFQESDSNASDVKKYEILDDVYKYQSKSKMDGIPKWAKIIIALVLIIIAIGIVIGAAFLINDVVNNIVP